jgi:hypothetical protein
LVVEQAKAKTISRIAARGLMGDLEKWEVLGISGGPGNGSGMASKLP